MNWPWCCCVLLCPLLGACAQMGDLIGLGKKKKAGSAQKPLSGLDAYRAAGGRVTGAEVVDVAAGGVAVARTSSAAGITPDSDIVWADEDPNKPIEGEELWKRPESKSWYVSHTEASKYARTSGKPMLIWFTDSAFSPLCRRLSDELFSKGEFETWAAEKLVRLRVDSTIPPRERNEDIGIRKAKYVEKLKRRYSVHGHPTVVIVSSRGQVLQRYRGYQKGNSDYYWGRIRQAVRNAENDYGRWREKLEKRGYRMWQSRDGRKTLAKLYRFRSGKVTLIDPDGNRARTSLSRLSDADQAWIMLQKKRYEARQGR